MPFQPATTLIICSGVPWDSTYTDTRIFANKDTQNAYFRGLAAFTFDESSYQREQNAMRVNIDAEKLHECNYICYLNANYGNKWMYGFIDRVEFVSGNASRIYFTIDVWQTYYFDLTFKPCFVEREHVNDDTIGANTLPENVELGPYITTNESNLINQNLGVVLFATESLEHGVSSSPSVECGYPISCYWTYVGPLSPGALSALKTIIDIYANEGKADSIVSIFTIPLTFWKVGELNVSSGVFSMASRTLPYTPRNNKLYTYPYCALAMNSGGSSSILRYELFSGSPSLSWFASFGPNMEINFVPNNYEGQNLNYQYLQTLKGWPSLPWSSNYFQNWLAQNSNSIATNIVTSVISMGAGIALTGAGALAAPASGGLSGALLYGGATTGLNSALNLANTVAKIQDTSIIPDKMNGTQSGASPLVLDNKVGVYTYCRTIKPEYMAMIDNYFDRVGYKVNRLKIPNITGRQSWNYVKTVGAEIVGKCPTSALNTIKRSMDNGITFWHTNDVGNYSLSNGVV